MLFSKWITIPADTSSSDPHEETVKICKGTVRRVWVIIPIPSAWCVGVEIWYASWQMWPTSRTEWIPGGMVEIEFEENVEIDEPPLHFIVKGYNEDTQNEHKVWVAFNVVRPVVSSRMQEMAEWLAQG